MRDVMPASMRDVETGGLQEVSSFKIAANAKMFRAMMSGLYSDKPRAIIRELCANAYDSHIAAGYPDRAFYLKLPTRYDTSFMVRDFGVSLTHDRIMDLYSTLGASTKDLSDKEVGKFGLGSKTPFAYTDSYNLGATIDGKKRIYNAFIDEDGFPKIALFGEVDTDEENGVEVSFPVMEKDISAFTIAAKRVIVGLPTMPWVNIPELIDQLAEKTPFEGKDWTVYKATYGSGFNGIHVRQGCVLYPLDEQIIGPKTSSTTISIFRLHGLVIDMPIGTVEITPSRESISYDEKTIKNILARFDNILTEITAKVVTEISSQPNMLRAMQARRQALDTFPDAHLRRQILGKVKWRNRTILEHLQLDLDKYTKNGLTIGMVNNQKSRWVSRADSRNNIVFSDYHLPVFLYYTGSVPPKYLASRFAALEAAKRIDDQAYIILLRNLDRQSRGFRQLMAQFKDPEQLEARMIDLATVEYEDHKLDVEMAKVKQLKYNKGYLYTEWTSISKRNPLPDNLIETEAYYVTLGRADIGFDSYGHHFIKRTQWSSLCRHLLGMGVINDKIIVLGVQKSHLGSFERKTPELWKPFHELLEKAAKLLDHRMLNATNSSRGYHFQNRISNLRTMVEKILPKLGADSPAREILHPIHMRFVVAEKMEKQEIDKDYANHHRKLYVQLQAINYNLTVDVSKQVKTDDMEQFLTDVERRLNKAYPFLPRLMASISITHSPNIATYMRYMLLEDSHRARERLEDSLFACC